MGVFAALIFVLETVCGLIADHPDLAKKLLKSAIGMLSGRKHDDAAAQAGLAAGLSAAASSVATTAMERAKRRAADAPMPMTEPTAEPAPDPDAVIEPTEK